MSTSRFPLQLDGLLEPEAVRTVEAAFDDAWHHLQAAGIKFARHADIVETRELLAKRIVKSARAGERSSDKLREAALLNLTRETRVPSPRFGSRAN